MPPRRSRLVLPLLVLGVFLCGGFWIGDSWWQELVQTTAPSGFQQAQAAANLEPEPKIAYRILVLDTEQEPLERAFVSLQQFPEYQWFTNQDGEVTLRVEPEAHQVTIVAQGFITQTFVLPLVAGRDEVTVRFQLKPNPMLQTPSDR